MGKFVAKYRSHEEDYSDGYDSTRYDSKKRKKESAEFRKMRQRHRDDELPGFEYVEKRYSKYNR